MSNRVASTGLRLPEWVRRAFFRTADFLYPPSCRLCGCDLPGHGVHPFDQQSDRRVVGPDAVFCADCERSISVGRTTACVHCGASIGPGLDPNARCGYCHDERFAFERVIRFGVYDGPLRSACIGMKQPGAETLAAALGELTWQAEIDEFRAARIDVVVPIPQFPLQRILRPHHAAETLAEVWSRRLQVPVAPHILRKVRWTRPQARLKPTERRSNLRHAFRAKPNSLAGATVLLADDVMTTGSTAHEASRQLRQAGAERVVVVVVARGLGRR